VKISLSEKFQTTHCTVAQGQFVRPWTGETWIHYGKIPLQD